MGEGAARRGALLLALLLRPDHQALEHLHDFCDGYGDDRRCALPFFSRILFFAPFYLLHARSAPLSRGGARVHSLSAYRMRNAHPHLLILPTGIGYDYFMNAIWDSVNKGKLWKDIKDNYAEED